MPDPHRMPNFTTETQRSQRKLNLIDLLTPVALTGDLPDYALTRGQIGTVVEHLERDGDQALLVEFSDDQGQAYAIAAVRPDQLMALLSVPPL